MKLETLKDLENKQNDATISRIELKDLAIKWVKEDVLLKHKINFRDINLLQMIVVRWMKRLNITEEDLQ